MPTIRAPLSLITSLFVLVPALAAAQQNLPPPPANLKAAETPALKAHKALIAEGAKVSPRMALMGKEQDLYAGLALSAQQKAQLQKNLKSLSCVPGGTTVPPGHVMMQVMPTPTGTGAPAAPTDECLSKTLDPKQLASFRAHLKGQLETRGMDVAEFERMAPTDCALTELKYYLFVLSLL